MNMHNHMILHPIILIVLALATISDFRKKEVPNFLSFFLLFSAIGIRIMFFIFNPSLEAAFKPLFGLAFALPVAFVLYYLKQWGGADAKLFIALGIALGWSNERFSIVNFSLLLLVAGGVYGIAFLIYLAVKQRKKLNFRNELRKRKKQFAFAIFVTLIIVFLSFKFVYVLPFALLPVAAFFASVFGKKLDRLFVKQVKPEELVEGDWIAQKYSDGNKIICTPKTIATKRIIRKLIALKKKKKLNYIKVKEGIPFIPSFLIAFVLLYFFDALALFQNFFG